MHAGERQKYKLRPTADKHHPSKDKKHHFYGVFAMEIVLPLNYRFVSPKTIAMSEAELLPAVYFWAE